MPGLKIYLILILCLLSHHVTRGVNSPCHDCIPKAQEPHVTLVCPAGHYFDNITHSCQPCVQGTFLKDDYTCADCDIPDENLHENIIKPCNKSSNTVLGCEEGFFRTLDPGLTCGCDWTCRACDICGVGSNVYLNYETRACTMFSNTICCRRKDMVVDAVGHCVSPGGTLMITPASPVVTPGGTTSRDAAVIIHVSASNRAFLTGSSGMVIAMHQILVILQWSARASPLQRSLGLESIFCY